MVDRRLGNRTPDGGPQNMKTTNRPQFEDSSGRTYSADRAVDAALAGGDMRGDLRGRPGRDVPGDTYANTRRRRPPVEATEQPNEPEMGARDDRRSARDPREMADRQHQERELTDDERVAMLRQGFFQVALPDLPKKTGVHRLWLTTTNPRDPIAARLRAGYRLLRIEDLGLGWEQQKATSGEYAGCVTINEMVAAEISETLYQRFMNELHHNMPREQERGIYGRLDADSEALRNHGSRLIYEDEGENPLSPHMRDRRRAPQVFES